MARVNESADSTRMTTLIQVTALSTSVESANSASTLRAEGPVSPKRSMMRSERSSSPGRTTEATTANGIIDVKAWAASTVAWVAPSMPTKRRTKLSTSSVVEAGMEGSLKAREGPGSRASAPGRV